MLFQIFFPLIYVTRAHYSLQDDVIIIKAYSERQDKIIDQSHGLIKAVICCLLYIKLRLEVTLCVQYIFYDRLFQES